MTSRKRQPIRKRSPYRVQITNRQKRFSISSRAVAELCAALLEELERPPCLVSVAFVGNRKMQQINRQYRNKSYATDVLSFPYSGEAVDDLPFLGEIVIAPDIAARDASRYKISFVEEVRKLVMHGMLHLLGYDHETDSGQMRRLENRLVRRSARTPDPLAKVRDVK